MVSLSPICMYELCGPASSSTGLDDLEDSEIIDMRSRLDRDFDLGREKKPILATALYYVTLTGASKSFAFGLA
jgi:hypothetical protein